VQAYNDWLVDEWAAASDRFIPQCIVPLGPVEATVAEVERAAARGHRGVIYPALPMHLREVPHINEPAYDRLWATCQEMGLPVCLHAGFSPNVQLPVFEGLSPKLADALRAMTGPAASVFAVTNMLLSRILMRFPDLHVIFAESTLGWGSFLLEYADHQFEQDRVYLEGYDLKPSELFKRQCYLTGWYDPVAIHTRYLPVERILWATNFPTTTSTWPTSQATIECSLAGLTDDQRQQVLWGNAARLYHL
jgi:predicted TIM-barrel fold metal-dependent hydrolase